MEHAKARPLVRLLRRLVSAGAHAYPLSLLALCVALSGVGESHWATAGLLYVPRLFFAAPLVVLVPALWLMGRKKLLWSQAAALLLVLFPLMGLVLPWPVSEPRGPTLRLLSFNVNSGHQGTDAILAIVDREQPDLVLFQESPWAGPLHTGLRERFAHFDHSTQFLLASRFPILERTEPEKLPTYERPRSPRFMRYVLDTNLGKLAVYSVHPISPRGTFGVQRFREMFHRMRKGLLWQGDPDVDLAKNAELRERQIAAAANMARSEPYPVIIAGDTNLPGLSAALRRHLSAYRDGFEAASWGFGYTFPWRRPFLRLDRVMVGPELEFSRFEVGKIGPSDHLPTSATLFRR